jgi:hypothetical protein
MKKKPNVWVIAIVAGFLPAVSFAEGGGNEDWAEKAAVQYEEKAAKAAAEENTHDAGIYTRMAQIKRDAGSAAKAGKEFSWDEYHALSGQLGGSKKGKGKDAKDAGWKNKSDDKKAEQKDKAGDKAAKVEKKKKANPGDGFISAAQEYQKLSIEAAKAGDSEKMGIYGQLAKIKLDAAVAANQGKGFDWTEYDELRKKLGE